VAALVDCVYRRVPTITALIICISINGTDGQSARSIQSIIYEISQNHCGGANWQALPSLNARTASATLSAGNWKKEEK